jgi:hypothetical protein
VSKPADGSAAGRWSDFGERDLFAHVAVRCYLDHEAGNTVSVARVLRDLAHKGFPLSRYDLEPRARVDAAMAARAAGDAGAIDRALAQGTIRRRKREYVTTSYTPLRDALYRVIDGLNAESPEERLASGSYYARCRAAVALVAKDWSADEGRAADMIVLMLERQDRAAE